MFDPMLWGPLTGTLSLVAAGMASEVGKSAWESAGALARRVTGRAVPAPRDAAEREQLARELAEAAARDPRHASAVRAWIGSSPQGATVTRTPRELPPSVRFFTDRRELLRELAREAGRKSDGRPRVALLHGAAGMGTSALAAHYGHSNEKAFPDGQLYVDLCGQGGTGAALAPAAAARILLGQLGVAAAQMPPATEDRTALLRELIGSRRLLVVLDHAATAAQVRPLITAAPYAFTVVVARERLAQLDAVPLSVGPLVERDAVRLLTELTDRQTVAGAAAVLPAVLERCGGSPFALRALAPRLSEPDLALSGAGREPVDYAVEAGTSGLDATALRVFRLMALWEWPGFGPAVAAHTAEIEEARAADALAELAARGLLLTTDDGRYRYRAAVRARAEREAAAEDGVVACAAALARTVRWYLEFAVRADRAALPQRWWLGPLYTSLDAGPRTRLGEAVAALIAERRNLVQATLAAAQSGDAESARQLGEAQWAVQLKAGATDELLPALRAAARAAGALYPGTRIEGRACTQLGNALVELGQHQEAERQLRLAEEAEAADGHRRGRATALECLGLLRLSQWNWDEAYALFERADEELAQLAEGDEGFEDAPRGRALLLRHRGRALRGLGRFDEAARFLSGALVFFEETQKEAYNAARTLTDLGEVHLEAEDLAAALPLLDRALRILGEENASPHADRVRRLRERCLSAG
ncbi:ATP-binding protein [Streptomyces sp. NA04227]|uniref:tetratricopeptide repeat protein n=1 Tax=Streptomyces sp. NA04227 TaxID=2742136 RepID=UPI0015906524|nr:tetratricopeptide repeat protein [Streptomyces sp. NA04227]QKW05674.1 ATP-binding protein [Streptomyces sp. NA04227]